MQTGYYDRPIFTTRKHFNPSYSAVYLDYDLFRPPQHFPQQHCMQMCDLFWYTRLLLQAMKHGCRFHWMRWKLFFPPVSLSDVWVSLLIVLPCQSSQARVETNTVGFYLVKKKKTCIENVLAFSYQDVSCDTVKFTAEKQSCSICSYILQKFTCKLWLSVGKRCSVPPSLCHISAVL